MGANTASNSFCIVLGAARIICSPLSWAHFTLGYGGLAIHLNLFSADFGGFQAKNDRSSNNSAELFQSDNEIKSSRVSGFIINPM